MEEIFKDKKSISIRAVLENLFGLDYDSISEEEIGLYRHSLDNLIRLNLIEIVGYDEEGYEVVQCTDEGFLYVNLLYASDIAEA